MKTTPGPWKLNDVVTRNNDTFRHGIHGANNRVIAWTLRHYDRDEQNMKTSITDDANARLIAAAPDLLAALQELIAEYENEFHNPTEGFEMARAAIAKVQS